MNIYTPFWELVASCGNAKGGLKDDISLPMFPESSSLTSRRVANLKSVPQIEVPGQVTSPWRYIGFFTGRLVVYWSLLSVWCPSCGSLPRTVFLIVTVLWGSETQASLDTGARWSRACLCKLCLPDAWLVLLRWVPVWVSLHVSSSKGVSFIPTGSYSPLDISPVSFQSQMFGGPFLSSTGLLLQWIKI